MHRFGLMVMGSAVALGLTAATAVQATEVTYSQPTFDRWNYPFNFNNGTRDVASTFSAVGTPGFDNADGQFYFAFDTSSDFAAGLGQGNYIINSVTVTVTTQSAGYAYDATYDDVSTFAGADPDAGRPIHLTAAGFRYGFNASSYGETGPFGPPGPPAPRVRTAFAADVSGGAPVDVSNFVTDGFNFNPLATGAVPGLAPGDAVPDQSTYTFEVDLSDPDVAAYFQSSLNDGLVPLSVISMQPTVQGGGANFPVPFFYAKESLNPQAVPATLTIDAIAVPEPTSLGLLGCVGVALLSRRRRS